MTIFQYSSHDDEAFVSGITEAQRNRHPYSGEPIPLRTSNSVRTERREGLTTYSVSELMQGMGAVRPDAVAWDAFNQSMSGDLGHFIRSEGGLQGTLQGRAGLVAYDILDKKGFDDGIFTQESGLPGGVASGIQQVTTGTGQTTPPPTVGRVTGDGMVFPVAATQSKIKEWGWCWNSSTNCHHSYNAADIFAPTGTPIVCAVGGEIVSSKNRQSEYGCSVRIRADDGLWYYYTHMGFNTGVQNWAVGARIETGNQIGLVGTNAEAQGTPSHLHFDISPVDNGFSRGYGYANGPLHDPQPALQEAFALLAP